VSIDGKPLDSGSPCDRRDRGGSRADRFVKLDDGLDDPQLCVIHAHDVNIFV
jgi:hypothetical protein